MKLKNKTIPRNGRTVFAHGLLKLVPINSFPDTVYIISLLNNTKFNNNMDQIRTTMVIKFQKDFLLFSFVYAATLCNKLLPKADGIIKKISIKVSPNHHIQVKT